MHDIDLTIVNFFSIPLSFLLIIFSALVIQSIIVKMISTHIGKIYFNHPILFKSMNYWAIFVHEFSHAITAIVTLNEVKDFKVSSSGGHVVHSSNRTGFFQWVAVQAISASPAFVPPILTVVFLEYLGYINIPNIILNVSSFDTISIISALYLDLIPYILKTIGILLVNLDYSKIENIFLLFILVFSFSAAKPSSIDKSKYGTQGDLQNLIERFIKYPKYTILLVLLYVVCFWLFLSINFTFYLYIFTLFTLLPVIAIVALACNYLFITLIHLFDKSSMISVVISVIAFALVYLVMPQYTEKQYLVNMASIAILIGILKVTK
ncbi:MAG TPA: hypothetical protein C5S51_09480 [Methanosarcinaceae archaeon]|nr:hypothetical protein [Methanosarcinaceae archaeon]